MPHPTPRRFRGPFPIARLAVVLGVAPLIALVPAAQASADVTHDVSEVTAVAEAGATVLAFGDDVAVFDGQLYFPASDADHGMELWAFDGESAHRVTDIESGPGNSIPSGLVVFDGALYFNARDSSDGAELWKWDGVSASQVVNLNPGSASSAPRYLTVFGDTLVFSADDGPAGSELWSYSNGSATRLTNLKPGLGQGSDPRGLTVVGSKLFFFANDGIHGEQLWVWDGTSATMLTSASASPYFQGENPTAFQGDMYFTANDHGTFRLWRSDGTPGGTQIVTDFDGSSRPDALSVAGSLLYLSASVGGDHELWGWDGTEPIRLTSDHSYPGGPLFAFEGSLFFPRFGPEVDADTSTFDAEGEGYELWAWDGTTTSLVADLNPHGNSFPQNFIEFEGTLYFTATVDESTMEMRLFRIPSLQQDPGQSPEPAPELAATGFDPAWPFLAALAFVVAGAGIAARRRARHNA